MIEIGVMKNMKDVSEMDREELIQLIGSNPEELDLAVLKQALDRIDEIDGVDKTEADNLIDAINEDSFDELPLEKQLEKLMQASQALIEEARNSKIDL